MSYRSNLLRHPAKPIRAIELHRIPGEGDLWQAEFRGDEWTAGFRTPPGYRNHVRDAILRADVRHGLPIIDEDGLHTPSPSRPIWNDEREHGWPGNAA